MDFIYDIFCIGKNAEEIPFKYCLKESQEDGKKVAILCYAF